MILSEFITSMRLAAGSAQAVVGADWMQGRSAFGGLQAAIALAAMRTLVAADTPLRTLQMTFIEPVGVGEVDATARVLRAGKSATHVEARLELAGRLLAHTIGVFGIGRESVVQRSPPQPTATASARVPLRFVPGITPAFLQHFEGDLLDGAWPFANKPVLRCAYELGLRDAGPATEAHVLAIADFVPPVALSWLPTPSPGASLTWMLELLGEDVRAQPLRGWRVDTEMIAARDGYTSQSTTIWAPNGAAVALSRQSMVVFA